MLELCTLKGGPHYNALQKSKDYIFAMRCYIVRTDMRRSFKTKTGHFCLNMCTKRMLLISAKGQCPV